MIDEGRVAHQRAKLHEIMHKDYSATRSSLRGLASPIFSTHCATNKVDLSSIKRSCSHEGMPDYKPTVSGVIMNCTIHALLDIIFSDYGCGNVLDALINPVRSSIPNSKSKSGYDFGRHIEVSDEIHDERIRWINSCPPSELSERFEESLDWIHTKAEDLDFFYPQKMGGTMTLAIIARVCELTDFGVETDKIAESFKAVFENFHETWRAEDDTTTTFKEKADGIEHLMDGEPLLPKEFVEKIADSEETINDQLLRANEHSIPFNGICSHIVHNLAQRHASIETSKSIVPKKTSSSLATKVAKASKDNLNLVNMTLKTIGLDDIVKLSSDMDNLSLDLDAQKQEVEELEKKLRHMSTSVSVAPTKIEASGEIPSGKQVSKKAHEIFNVPSKSKKMFDFDILMWEWDSPHPYVPAIDNEYIFRPSSLLRILFGLNTNQRIYISGHTGSGKTTLVEQICARLFFPFMRVNFDSEITRMDLLGRDVLTTGSSGATESKFVEGILPKMMATPCIGCFDEIDFIRPDVAYVMQRAFEGNGLMLTEDGGRVVQPHPQFRMIATGNTVGQGDEFGMYQGARPQSMAMIDRFTIWINVPYLDKNQRDELIKKKVPLLTDDLRQKLNQYVGEHLEAFKTSKVLQPISPRGMLSLANTLVTFTTLFNGKDAIEESLSATILDRCSQQDRAVLKGIVNRIFETL